MSEKGYRLKPYRENEVFTCNICGKQNVGEDALKCCVLPDEKRMFNTDGVYAIGLTCTAKRGHICAFVPADYPEHGGECIVCGRKV